ncbi:SH3 domain-containing protein [Candidatus Pantoea multigeneris]|jgi:hypothetical protein|uniref:SH3 domain-containing protein n=1 Tax=Candidatus Pantoea multigeneris TaxID=2608357 RepID=A0ABX0R7V8_9GAMM|nr:SH3 domain-containing protein [Pantoea multigeneris]NIF20238.1 SH3 domain-containing protein [Pantoea multigeneris]
MTIKQKLPLLFSLLCVLVVAGCKAPPPPLTDDSIVSSTVDGVTLSYRHAITPPAQFEPVNKPYRALYDASVMSKPGFNGNLVKHLENGQGYTVLGTVENNWFAIAEGDSDQLVGYVPLRAGVAADRYDATVRADSRRVRRAPAKKTCVSVDGDSKACRNSNNGTWILN